MATPQMRGRSKSPARAYTPKIDLRLEEKDMLVKQNDRLASYIDRMRSLEEENNKLVTQITNNKETKVREVSNIKSLYEHELTEARKLLDEQTNEKAKITLENNKLKDQVKSNNEGLSTLEKERNDAEMRCKRVDSELAELRTRYHNTLRDKTDANEKIKALEQEIAKLKDALAHSKKECEDELLRRVDAENQLLSVREEREFGEQVHKKELAEMTSVMNTEVVEETDYTEEYDKILCDKLRELREEFTHEALLLKQQLQDAYENKVNDAKEEAASERQHSNTLQQRVAELRVKLDEVKNELGPSKIRIESLEKTLADLREDVATEREEHKAKTERLEGIIEERDAALEDCETEFQKLMHAKVSLDLEIQAYKKMLDGEDERQTNTPKLRVRSVSQTTSSRKRVHPSQSTQELTRSVSNTASGCLQIDSVDTEKNLVRIYNSSPEDMKLGGHIISHVMEGTDPVEYKFTPKYTLKGNEYATVWGENSGEKHKPPTDLLMRSGNWSPADPSVKFSVSVLGEENVVLAQWTEEPMLESAETVSSTSSTSSITETRSTKRIRRTGGSRVEARDSCILS